MYNRLIEPQLEQQFFKSKVVILTGARQTGKTTLVKKILAESAYRDSVRFFNCDNPTDRDALNNQDLEFLKGLIGNAKLVFIDEGQKVETIGQTLKLLVDYYQDQKQILVTGSSSFKTSEALTGRKFVFHLFPLSLEEIYSDKNMLTVLKELPTHLVYGNYPEVAGLAAFADKKRRLEELAASYLYRDILEFQKIKSPTLLTNLLRALAWQIGSEVSYTELSSLLGIDKNTIERYVDILEKNYIVFRLSPYATNKRKEISKLRKIYFFDVGIRNALINNFNPLEQRNDIGVLWENFILVERMKFRAYHEITANDYFWRTYGGAEIDLVEEREGQLFGYEFKWQDKKRRAAPSIHWRKYRNSTYEVIDPQKMPGFVW